MIFLFYMVTFDLEALVRLYQAYNVSLCLRDCISEMD